MEKRNRSERRLRVKDLDYLPTGWHDDGGGLRFVVLATGARRWVQRLTINRKRVNRGLGGYPLVSLQAARDKSDELRRSASEGKDARAVKLTFARAFEQHFAQREQGLKSAKHIYQWRSSIETHALPRIGERPVAEITHDEIVAIVRPIWRETPETARRVLRRMSIIFDIVISRGIRGSANPCTGVAKDLGKQGDRIEHLRSLPWAEVPAFIPPAQSLRRRSHHQARLRVPDPDCRQVRRGAVRRAGGDRPGREALDGAGGAHEGRR